MGNPSNFITSKLVENDSVRYTYYFFVRSTESISVPNLTQADDVFLVSRKFECISTENVNYSTELWLDNFNTTTMFYVKVLQNHQAKKKGIDVY